MCGIVGIVDVRERRQIDRSVLFRMNQAQHHRGPDEDGLHLAAGVGLGHKRLSIIDLATGQQPLFNEDGSVVVVYNGEIYNYRELIPELTELGHVFHTRSDTEVIVHAWEQWGASCVNRFRGMFAFALWDERQQTLFLARDRLGVKPLYYALLPDGHLIFGSELKALLAHGGLSREIHPRAVEEYLALGYVPELATIFAGAYKLPPAHTLTIRRGEAVGEPCEYWDVQFTLAGAYSAGGGPSRTCRASARVGPPADDLRGAAGRVPVRRCRFQRCRCDDGRAIAEPVNTCSISFADPAFDESRFAQQVADRYRDSAFHRSRRKRRLRPDRHARDALRRALCRQFRDPDLSGVPARAPARYR